MFENKNLNLFFYFLILVNMSFSEETYYFVMVQAYREVEVTWQATSNKHRLDAADVNTINSLFVKTEHLLNKASNANERRDCWVHILKIVSLLNMVDCQLNFG